MEEAKCEQFEKEVLSLKAAGGVRSLTLEYLVCCPAWLMQTLFSVFHTICSMHSYREQMMVITGFCRQED